MPRIPFTAATAAAMAARAHESRRNRLIAAREIATNAIVAPQSPNATSHYQASRLARVRVMMDNIDKKISSLINEADAEVASAIDRLVSAQARLAEQERVLSGRPLPGSLRPRASKQSGPSKSSQAIADEGVEDGMPNA